MALKRFCQVLRCAASSMLGLLALFVFAANTSCNRFKVFPRNRPLYSVQDTLHTCARTIVPETSDGCWGSSTPAAHIVAAVPDSMFTTGGPEQVVSHTHFTFTLLHVMVFTFRRIV